MSLELSQGLRPLASPVRAIDRAIQVLLEISRSNEGPTALELSQRTGLPLSTVYRLVDSLKVHGLIIEGYKAGRFMVGPTAHEVGARYRGREHLIEVASPVMERLARTVGETANLAMVEAGRAVYVHQVDSPDKLMRMVMEHDVALPIHCSGVGKVLLAWADSIQSQRLREGLDFQEYTPKTVTTMRQLDFCLEHVRDQGYALDDEEREAGVRCVAVPIHNRTNRVVAALSVSGPTSRLTTERVALFVAQLQDAAASISSHLQ